MFKKSIDDRLSFWAEHRSNLDTSETPFSDVWEFWKNAPYIQYNHKIDPYHQRNWPSPWEIIVENHYDDFTKALMIGWTIKLSDRYKDSRVEVRTLVDKTRNAVYNIVYVDEEIAINYSDSGPVNADSVPDSFIVENLIELNRPR
jgi:hypothetical protein